MSMREPRQPKADLPDRIEHAFAARESSMYSHALMEGMINQTLAPYHSIDGVTEVSECGIDPLVTPANCPFNVGQFRQQGRNAVIFAHKGVMYLYSLGSASQVNTPEGDNAWMELLCEFVREFRPKRLHVASFNRLIRSALFSGELMGVVQDAGTIVIADSIKIDLTTPDGRVLWQTLAMLADLERESIVQRLFAGIVNKYERGQWILSPLGVPPGYKLVDGKPMLDPAQVDDVRFLIGLLGNTELTCRQVVDAAGARGLTSMTIQQIHGPDATYADVRRADSKVRSLLDCVPLWTSGVHLATLPNPYRGAKRIGRLPVLEGGPAAPHGVVEFPYALPLPHGGWAPADVLHAAAARTRSRKDCLRDSEAQLPSTGGAAHRRRRPFAGRTSAVAADGTQFRIGGQQANYTLMRRDGGTDL